MKRKMVDLETGEVFEVLIFGRNLKYTDRGFVKVFSAFLADVVTDEEVAGKSVRLLLYMISKVSWNNLQVTVFPEEAAELGIGRSTFYRWLRVLMKRGYVRKVRAHCYVLRPYSVVRGSMRVTGRDWPIGTGV